MKIKHIFYHLLIKKYPLEQYGKKCPFPSLCLNVMLFLNILDKETTNTRAPYVLVEFVIF